MMSFSIVLFFSYIVSGTRFERIKKSELVHFNVKESSSGTFIQFIEFEAFNEHYHVDLIPNHNLNPALVHHVNPRLDGEEDYYIGLNHTCHYHGNVKGSADSLVAISICPRGGIEGTIVAFGEEIEIAPTRSYFDIGHHHTALDEHLIFKLSDYDNPIDTIFKTPLSHRIFIQNKTNFVGSKRKLLAANNIAHYILADYSMYQKYSKDYGASSYKNKLQSRMSSVINMASSIYAKNNFVNGAISLSLNKFEVATSSGGTYRGLGPSNTFEAFRRKFEQWLKSNKGSSHWKQYAANFIYTEEGYDYMGWAQVGVICLKATAAMSMNDADITKGYVGRVHAHEVGHNLGCYHDSEMGCSGKLMRSSVNGDYFSSCSLNSIKQHWSSTDMSCVAGGGSNSYDNNNNNNNNNNYNNNNNDNSGGSCVKIRSLSEYGGRFNKEWSAEGSKNGYNSYKVSVSGSNYYLFAARDSGTTYWTISQGSKSASWSYGWCTSSGIDIFDCPSWSSDSDVRFKSCGSFEDTLPCLEDNPLDRMCVYNYNNNGSLWVMKLEESDCLFNKAIYEYYDDDKEESYYLHYDEYYKYDTDDTLSSRWVISQGIADTNSYHCGYCEQSDLMNCDGNWMVQQIRDDAVVFEPNENMIINQDCVVVEAKESNGADVESIFIALIIVFIIVVILLVILFFWKKRKEKQFKKNVEIVMEEEEEEEEVEEIEVTVPINTIR